MREVPAAVDQQQPQHQQHHPALVAVSDWGESEYKSFEQPPVVTQVNQQVVNISPSKQPKPKIAQQEGTIISHIASASAPAPAVAPTMTTNNSHADRWETLLSPDGNTYYYDTATGTSTWERPTEISAASITTK